LQIKELLKTKKMRYGINATALTVMFIVVIILVNMLAGVASEKFPSINIDLSENGQFEISKATKEAIKDISKDIKMTVILYEQTSDIFIDELLGRYKEINGKITSSYIDPAKNPTAIQKYEGINPRGTLIVESGERYEAIDFDDLYGEIGRMEDAESLVTNAIVSVTSDEEKNILFTTGHGEKDFDTLLKTVEKKFFNKNVIDIRQSKIENCDILAICAPSSDFTQQEIAAVEAFVRDGGNLQIYLDPESAYLPNLAEYIKEWGIEVKNETVCEKNSNYIYAAQSGYIPVYSENDYTKSLTAPLLYKQSFRLNVLYSETKGVTNYPVLTTTDKATTLVNSADSGAAGKYNIAIMSERVLDNSENTIVKMFLSGSTLLFNESYSNQFVGNADMALAVVQGMLSAEDYVEIETKKSEAMALQMTVTQVIFVLVVLVLIAVGILVLGIVIWSKRRFL